jgi:hypothetical protein
VNSFIHSESVAHDVIHLSVIPHGPVLQGSTIVIECRVPNKDLLDIVRLIHQSTAVAKIDYEMTTNGYLEKQFSSTGRYRIVKWDNALGLVQLQIKGQREYFLN